MKEDDSPVQAFKMAVAFAQSGDYSTAKNILEDVLDKVKEDKNIENKNEILASILNLLGNINFELGEISLAKENFKEALDYKPEADTIKSNLSYVKNLLGENDKES
jgi:tetratricopeptide (TPR) repeat protein